MSYATAADVQAIAGRELAGQTEAGEIDPQDVFTIAPIIGGRA